MGLLLGHFAAFPLSLLPPPPQPTRHPLSAQALKQRLEEVAHTNHQHREAQLVDGTDGLVLLRAADELGLNVDQEGTHGEVDEDEEGEFAHQAEHLASVGFVLFHSVGSVLEQGHNEEVGGGDGSGLGERILKMTYNMASITFKLTIA